MSVQGKTKRKSNLKSDVVMKLFLYDTLTIRNLTKLIEDLDRKLAREFASFNRISESIEKKNGQILDLLLEPIFRLKRLEKARSRQQRDLARSFGIEEQIGRLLEARSESCKFYSGSVAAFGGRSLTPRTTNGAVQICKKRGCLSAAWNSSANGECHETSYHIHTDHCRVVVLRACSLQWGCWWSTADCIDSS